VIHAGSRTVRQDVAGVRRRRQLEPRGNAQSLVH